MPEYRELGDIEVEGMANRMRGNALPAKSPRTSDGVEVVFQTGHAGGIPAFAQNPNGHYIAPSGSQGGTVKIWDVASGQEIRNFTG